MRRPETRSEKQPEMLLAILGLLGILQTCDPARELCWPLPVYPTVVSPTQLPLVLPTPQHTSAYATYQPTADANLDGMIDPVNNANDTVDNWLGDDPNVTNPDGGDFDTGLSPLQDSGSAFDWAESTGASIGGLWELARALAGLTQSGLGIMVLAMLAAAAWFALLHILIFAIQIGDMVLNLFDHIFTWVVEIWQSIPFKFS